MKSTIIIFFILAFTTYSCNETIEYKYLDKGQPVDCSEINSKLMHEALYSFEVDIAKKYNFKNYSPTENLYIKNGYANFIYRGAKGVADFKEIASPHTLKIFKELLKEKDLWLTDSDNSNLNYKHPFVICLLSNIKNSDIKATLLNLNEANSLDPALIADLLRKNIRDADTDKYFAMYIALDMYYQNLINVDFLEATTNE